MTLGIRSDVFEDPAFADFRVQTTSENVSVVSIKFKTGPLWGAKWVKRLFNLTLEIARMSGRNG